MYTVMLIVSKGKRPFLQRRKVERNCWGLSHLLNGQKSFKLSRVLIYQMGYLVPLLTLPLCVQGKDCRQFSMSHGGREVMLLGYSFIPTAFRSFTYGEFKNIACSFLHKHGMMFPLDPQIIKAAFPYVSRRSKSA